VGVVVQFAMDAFAQVVMRYLQEIILQYTSKTLREITITGSLFHREYRSVAETDEQSAGTAPAFYSTLN
jgi:hypothetical protein